MKNKLAAFGLLASASWASAQTQISVSLHCASPSFHGTMDVGDRPSHTMLLSQRQCAWSRPLTIEGVTGKEDILSFFTEKRGGRARDRGYGAITMSNGDKIFMHCETASGEGTFAFSGGTGQFIGIYGSGTLKSRSLAKGEMAVLIDGQYTVPKF